MNKLSYRILLLACLAVALVAGGPDGAGGLMLQTAGGAQQMRFSNGGPATE